MTEEIIQNLNQTKGLLLSLSQEQYTHKCLHICHASIGQHVRHVIEFYQCLFNFAENGAVNYDARKRNLTLETDITFAITQIENVNEKLIAVSADASLTLHPTNSLCNKHQPLLIPTSLFRELVYNLEHSIHHQALIKVALSEMGLTHLIDNAFGFAPSTLRYKNTQCAQ